MEFLSDEWCQALVDRSCNEQPIDVRDVVIELAMTGAPRGRGRLTFVFDGGRLTRCAPEPSKNADLKLKTSFEEAQAMFLGSLDPNVAFMRGDLKTDGPTGLLLALLDAWRRPGADAFRAALAAHGS